MFPRLILSAGPRQASPEASLAELDPQYDSLMVDLMPRLEYMPSISVSEMGTIDEGSGSDVEGLPDLAEYDYHSKKHQGEWQATPQCSHGGGENGNCPCQS